MSEYSPEDIQKALNNEIQSRKTRSIKQNQLTYMKNSYNWLKDQEFEAWIDSNTHKEVNSNNYGKDLE